MTTKKEPSFFEDWQSLIEDFEKFTKSENNPFFKSKFVPLKDILPVVKEKCHKHNFIFMQYPELLHKEENGAVEYPSLKTVIEHISGRIVKGNLPLTTKDPNDPQKLGGAITYMRRYSLTCMFGLEEDDDDGNNASKPTTKQYTSEELYDLAKANRISCSECKQPIFYEEYKVGEKAGQPKPLKCSNWQHKGFIVKPINKEKAPF